MSESEPERWLDEHGDALYAYAITRVGVPAVAEDLVQETLLGGIEGRSRFKAESSTRTWLISILKNKLIDRLRKVHREEPLDIDIIDDEQWQSKFDDTDHWVVSPREWGDPSDVHENAALGQAMMRCIEKLPDPLRALIVMRDIDGIETPELIEILNISSKSNLWVMLSRGRERLRLCMDKTWFAEGSP